MAEQLDFPSSEVSLSEEAQRLYLNYAFSVIMGRALPDVRDGLKPVQRRILFAMHNELRVGPDAKPAKCARIVGDVIGKYHPHGDSAVYEALVRLAQDWVMRAPLVIGQGNFGSLDGDSAAAYRYTEARLSQMATELLTELPKKTVSYRPTFDGTRFEPVVLPARFPNLLVNGSQGIAVGMATSIPPHNLGEVIDALTLLVDEPETTNAQILRKIRGPDFPTGGELVTEREELRKIYETGQGTLKIRGEWKLEEQKGTKRIIITSVPYALEKQALVEKIADVIISKKLPALVDVRDESTEAVRIVLETKRDTNPDLIMAYLYKHTPLMSNVQLNLTCLVPSSNPDVPTPERLDLRGMLKHFLKFRFEVVQKRLTHELADVERRLHILEGFEKVFDALDEIIRIIRKSEGKADAAAKIIKRFDLDAEQTDAILELRLYRLAKLEILVIREELAKKRAESKLLRDLLASEKKLWGVVRTELREVREKYATRRKTKVLLGVETQEFSAEDFILDEDAFVIASELGWVKRQGTVKDLSSTRIKEGDRVLACIAGSTRAGVAFFSNLGSCYVARIADIPPSTGYGDPIQKLFKFADGEKLVAAYSLDPRSLAVVEANKGDKDASAGPLAVALTKQGFALRFSLAGHREPSTKNGRKITRLKDDDEVVGVYLLPEQASGFLITAHSDGSAFAVNSDELALLSSPGRGSVAVKLAPKAEVIGGKVADALSGDALVALTPKGTRYEIDAKKVRGARGGRAKTLVKSSGFSAVEHALPEIPNLSERK